jgi:hypothetical protein
MTHRNVFLAQRRGGVYNQTPADIDQAFLKSLQESNERPEWYGLEWAMRFSQPSVFVIRQYLKDGGDPAWARQKLFFEGWEEHDIDVFINEYTPAPTAAQADKHVTSSQTRLITALHKAYLANVLTDAEATSRLEAAGLTPAAAAGVLANWQQERSLEDLTTALAPTLTPTQIGALRNAGWVIQPPAP